MADPKYDIYFRGEILAGADEANVKAAVAKIFKADAAKLAVLFSGKVNSIKKAVDKTTAAKYQQAFKQAGAKLVITLAKEEQVSIPVNSSKATTQPSIVNKQESTISEGSWDVLPTGSDLLKPDERRNIPDADIDTSGIKVVSPFAEIEVSEKVVPPAPSTSHITVADVGEDMNPERVTPVADLELDLSSFTVAEPGAELTDKKEKSAPLAPDTSHIKLV
jgi:microcompartment protein CcmL/EutN